jgi:hypothetical protein
MDAFGELLGSDHRHTLEFFIVGLKDVSDPNVNREELFYNASVLAHYAQRSTDGDIDTATPADLTAVFDNFVAETARLNDPSMMETAGAQCLLLAGFFEDQMRRRHNIHWYAELGASFFRRAADLDDSRNRGQLLIMLSRRFELWRQRHASLSRELRDMPYLLAPRYPRNH